MWEQGFILIYPLFIISWKHVLRTRIKCLVLDRPNPNGFYFDGNILDTAYSSFVGMHPVPVVHGMTVGEYARW